MSRRANFLEGNDNFREQNLRFVRNEFEDNMNQFFGGNNGAGGGPAMVPPPRDSLIVQPKPGQLEECRQFLSQLGLNPQTAHALAVRSLEHSDFDMREFRHRRLRMNMELGDNRQHEVDAMILNQINDRLKQHGSRRNWNRDESPIRQDLQRQRGDNAYGIGQRRTYNNDNFPDDDRRFAGNNIQTNFPQDTSRSVNSNYPSNSVNFNPINEREERGHFVGNFGDDRYLMQERSSPDNYNYRNNIPNRNFDRGDNSSQDMMNLRNDPPIRNFDRDDNYRIDSQYRNQNVDRNINQDARFQDSPSFENNFIPNRNVDRDEFYSNRGSDNPNMNRGNYDSNYGNRNDLPPRDNFRNQQESNWNIPSRQEPQQGFENFNPKMHSSNRMLMPEDLERELWNLSDRYVPNPNPRDNLYAGNWGSFDSNRNSNSQESNRNYRKIGEDNRNAGRRLTKDAPKNNVNLRDQRDSRRGNAISQNRSGQPVVERGRNRERELDNRNRKAEKDKRNAPNVQSRSAPLRGPANRDARPPQKRPASNKPTGAPPSKTQPSNAGAVRPTNAKPKPGASDPNKPGPETKGAPPAKPETNPSGWVSSGQVQKVSKNRRRKMRRHGFFISGKRFPHAGDLELMLPQPEAESYAVQFFAAEPDYYTNPNLSDEEEAGITMSSDNDSDDEEKVTTTTASENPLSKSFLKRMSKEFLDAYKSKDYKNWANWWKDFKWCEEAMNKKLESFGNMNLKYRFLPAGKKGTTEQVVALVLQNGFLALGRNLHNFYRNMKGFYGLMNETFLENLTPEQLGQLQDMIRKIPNHVWQYKMHSMVNMWTVFHKSTKDSPDGKPANVLAAMAKLMANPVFNWTAKMAFEELKSISETVWPDHEKEYEKI